MDNQEQNKNGNENGGGGFGKWPFVLIAIGIAVIMMFSGSRLWSSLSTQFSEEISYDQFLENVTENKVEEAVLYDTAQWRITLKNDNKTYYTSYIEDDGIVDLLKSHGVTFSAQRSSSFMEYFLVYILPLILMVGFFIFLTKRLGSAGGMGGIMGLSLIHI